MRRGDEAQLQLLEAILGAIFIFVAIAVAAVYRLPTSPQTFQESELQNVALDALKVRQARAPIATDDCNETPCPFANDLDRMLSLALGYRGRTVAGSGEAPDAAELTGYLDQALPPGARYLVAFSNGVNHTILTPVGLTPPSASVSVARTLVAPNWTAFASGLDGGVLLRVNESTEWSGVTSLQDPLNRTSTEFGTPWASLYASRVPPNATFGTHSACQGAPCTPVTVVPSNVVPAGSFVAANDRSPSTNVRSAGTLASRLRYHDAGDAGFGDPDPLYLDMDGSGAANAGDVRLSRVATCRAASACREGTYVRAGDADIARVLASLPQTDLNVQSTDATLSPDDEVWLVKDVGRTLVAAGDVRITRVGLDAPGSHVQAGSGSVGAAAAQTIESDLATIDYVDVDGDAALDEGEPVFLNVQELGQSAALEVNDLGLATFGEPTVRYAYDLKVVVWYGV